jgi:hypothetical protein
MKKLLGLLVFVGFLLSACAPAIPGSSRYTAFDARDFDEITITAGPEWFALTIAPAGLVGRSARNDALNTLFKQGDYVVGTKKSASVNWYKIQNLKAPTNWVVEIADQKAIRTVTRVEDQVYYAIDSEEITWLIKVPPSTPVGHYLVLISIANRDDSSRSSTEALTVNVVKPAQ